MCIFKVPSLGNTFPQQPHSVKNSSSSQSPILHSRCNQVFHSLVQSEALIALTDLRNHITSYCSDNFTLGHIYCNRNPSRSVSITTPTNNLPDLSLCAPELSSLCTRIFWCRPAIGAELSFTHQEHSPYHNLCAWNHKELQGSHRPVSRFFWLIHLPLQTSIKWVPPVSGDSVHLKMASAM